MKWLLTILFPAFSFAQDYINPKVFGAKGDGNSDDTKAIQLAIDSAVKVSGTVYLPNRYRITAPLIAAKWDSLKGDYVFFTIKIKGEATMWDINSRSVITASHKDGPAIAIHRGKNCVIEGLNLQGAYRSPVLSDSAFYQSAFDTYGDPTCRDKQYSPYAGIVIDPFRSTLPPDGGYPTLQKWYRGQGGSGGSTGNYIYNCTVNNFTIGIILSPNGQTANADLHKIEDIRFYNTKASFVGCQAQEKSNFLIRLNCWGRTHTMFSFGSYGAGSPGMYFIDGTQIAGGVVRLIDRSSGSYYPVTMDHIFAESLGSIGRWQSNVNDIISNSTIHFVYPDQASGFPANGHVYGGGVTFFNCVIRYYGRPSLPILFNGEYSFINTKQDQPIIYGLKGRFITKPGYNIEILGIMTGNKMAKPVAPGSPIVFMDYASWTFKGLGIVGPDSLTIKNSSSNIPTDKPVGYGKYTVQ